MLSADACTLLWYRSGLIHSGSSDPLIRSVLHPAIHHMVLCRHTYSSVPDRRSRGLLPYPLTAFYQDADVLLPQYVPDLMEVHLLLMTESMCHHP